MDQSEKIREKLSEIYNALETSLQLQDAEHTTSSLFTGNIGILLFLGYYAKFSGLSKVIDSFERYSYHCLELLSGEISHWSYCNGLAGSLSGLRHLNQCGLTDIDLFECEKLVENKSVSKVQCDSYSRELERYGAERYQDSETLFHIDSISILQLLKAIKESPDSDTERWRTALRLIDDTLSGFGLTDDEKRDFMFAQSEGFKQEFGYVSIPLIRQLNDTYRGNRKNAESAFLESGKGFTEEVTLLFTERRQKIKELSNLLLFSPSADKKELYRYLASIVHMTMNRLFHSSNRMYEMVIYDFLHRIYKSKIARITDE